MEITLNSTEETKQLAQEVANTLNKGDILALYGDLGSGKTTFTRYLVEALGFEDRVQSPTFIIHRIYNKNKNINKNTNIINKDKSISENKLNYISKINHFDLYRLINIEEVLDMGFEDILKEDSLTIIEWPEVIQNNFIKEKTKKMYFEYLDDEKRKVTIK